MNIIKLNNTEFEVESYNKNTYFTGNTVMSNANCAIKVVNATSLNELITTPITSIQITNTEKNEVIYSLTNIHAKIDSMNEYLNGDRMSTNINLTFVADETEENEEEEENVEP